MTYNGDIPTQVQLGKGLSDAEIEGRLIYSLSDHLTLPVHFIPPITFLPPIGNWPRRGIME